MRIVTIIASVIISTCIIIFSSTTFTYVAFNLSNTILTFFRNTTSTLTTFSRFSISTTFAPASNLAQGFCHSHPVIASPHNTLPLNCPLAASSLCNTLSHLIHLFHSTTTTSSFQIPQADHSTYVIQKHCHPSKTHCHSGF